MPDRSRNRYRFTPEDYALHAVTRAKATTPRTTARANSGPRAFNTVYLRDQVVCGVAGAGNPSAMPATKRVSNKSANAAEKVPKPLATRVAKAKKRPATAKRAAGAAEKTTTSRKRSAPAKSGDAIAVLKQDHRRVEQLFKRLEKAG